MNSLIKILTKFGLLKDDLDYHLVRASMVIIFFFFGYQIVALSLETQRDEKLQGLLFRPYGRR
jgi:fucose permease